jgi:hypothetical protein
MSELAPIFDYADSKLGAAMSRGGMINTAEEVVLSNIRSAIARQHQQARPFPPNGNRVCLVGSGPTLNDTVDELRDLYFDGAKVVTCNGAYHWCIERNIRPSMQVVLDARPSNARFLEPAVPKCHYMLASQCAPEAFDAVADRENVWIFHAHAGDDTQTTEILDGYYGKNRWVGIGGGVTVGTRAIVLLRMLGYMRFDLFGVDCCWKGDVHHAMPQPENEKDRRIEVTVADAEGNNERLFTCSPWQLKQAEDFAQLMKTMGDNFTLSIHGDSMLAHMAAVGDITLATDEATAT